MKCPQCGHEMLFSDLVDGSASWVKAKIVSCPSCHRKVALNGVGLTIFTYALLAFVISIGIFLVAPMFWSRNVQNYLLILPTLAILVALISLRFTKLELTEEK
jgi:hypothetical protein